MSRHFLKWLIFLIFCVLSLAACTSSSPSIIPDNAQEVWGGASFGQTFTAKNKGLNGISVMLGPVSTNTPGSLLFHLRSSLSSSDDIARARLPISEISRQAYYKFDFPAQADSQGKDYYLQVDVEDAGLVVVYFAPMESYLDGALYINQFPMENQLAFQLQYDKKELLLGALQTIAGWIPGLLLGLIAFILPGWGLFSLFWRGWDELIWPVKLGLSGGLSLAIYPVLILWTGLVGLHLGLVYALLPPVVGLVALGWKKRKSFIQMPELLHSLSKQRIRSNFPPPEVILADLAFIVILGLVIASRFWIIRNLDIPLFGDSYQHTMISQLLVDHGGLFDSWAPYADLVTFTYHFGFHSAAAVYHWISGATIEKSVLWTGQLVNILAILALYPIAVKITHNRWAGVIAMLVGGLLVPMPNYYVNWGRYTQLAGQVILLPLIWCAWTILERSLPTEAVKSRLRNPLVLRNFSLDVGSLVITWLLLAGEALTHYRILVLALLFYLAMGIFAIFAQKLTAWVAKTVWMGLGGMLLFLPWFIRVFGGRIVSIFSAIAATPVTASASGELVTVAGNLRAYLPLGVWILLVICLVVGLVKRNKDIAIIATWWLLIFLAANPNLLRLPGAGILPNFAVLIAAYIPASLVIGVGLAWLFEYVRGLKIKASTDKPIVVPRLALSTFLLLIICGLGVWGGSGRMRELDPMTFELVTRPDLRAMGWIRANTSNDSQFLINSFPAFNGTSIVGSDGGWWLPLLAGRRNNVPPLTYAAEKAADPGLAQHIIEFYNNIRDTGVTSPQALALLKEQGINYIYIGQRQGKVNYSGPQTLDPQVLSSDEHFKLVYHEDGVWIFAIQ